MSNIISGWQDVWLTNILYNLQIQRLVEVKFFKYQGKSKHLYLKFNKNYNIFLGSQYMITNGWGLSYLQPPLSLDISLTAYEKTFNFTKRLPHKQEKNLKNKQKC